MHNPGQSLLMAHAATPSCSGNADEDDDSEGEGWQAGVERLPQEVLQVVLQRLDPLSLAAVACCCR